MFFFAVHAKHQEGLSSLRTCWHRPMVDGMSVYDDPKFDCRLK